MRPAIALVAILLVILTVASGYLLLQACGLRLPLLGTVVSACEDDAILDTRRSLTQELARSRDLAAEVAALERDLALKVCKADPPPPPPPPPPPEPETPSGLAPDAFEDNDISVMEGCWELSSQYDVRDIRTGQVTSFRSWQICFDAAGNGREVMRATDGTRCEGRLSGNIADGRLDMREPGNLQCSNGSEIFRRDIRCALDAGGSANCTTYQPETNGRGNAKLRRARR